MTVYLNGVVIPFVKKGLVISERLNEELDSANLIFYSKSITETVRPYSLVRIVISNEDYYFFVLSDECSRVSKLEEIYQHNLVLVELTRKLTTVLVDNISFTRELGNSNISVKQAVDRVLDITPLSVEANHLAERLFSLDTTTAIILATKSTPELVVENKNLLETLIELYKPFDFFPLLLPKENGKYVISHIDFNLFQEVLTEQDFKVGLSKHMSMEDFQGSITLNVENAINEHGQIEIYPSNTRYFTVVSEKDMIASSNTIVLKLPNPIYKILKVELLMYFTKTTGIRKLARDVDITNYVFEKKIYETLELETGNFNQSNSLYYNQYENVIYGLGNTIQNVLGFVNPALQKIINEVPVPGSLGGYSKDSAYNTISTGEVLDGKFGFRVSYIPVLNNKIRIFKDPVEFSDMLEHSQYGNQSTNIPNTLNMINNIKSTLNRTSNSTITEEIVVSNYSDRFKVGQKYGDFIISEVVHKIFDENYVKSSATFSKYFNRLSSQIGINQEERQYRILLNEKTTRKLVYNDFVVFDTQQQSSSSSLSSDGRLYILRQFSSTEYNISGDTSIEGAFVRTYDAGGNLIGKFLFDITKMDSNSFNAYYLDFESNYAANRYLTDLRNSGMGSNTLLTLLFGDKVNVMKSNKYALDGKVEKMSVSYFNILSNELTGFFLESFVRNRPLTTAEGMPSHIYVKELVSGLNYNFYLAIREGANYVYYLTDRKSILNDFYVNYSSSTWNRFWPNTSSTLVQSAKNHLAWFADGTPSAPPPKNNIATMNNLIVKKDNGEKLSFSYQLNYITRSDKIIIGNFAINNTTHISRVPIELYFYLSTNETYKFGDTKPRGVKQNIPWQYTYVLGPDGNYGKISMNYNFANYQLAGGTLLSPNQQQIDDYLLANVKSWGIAMSGIDLHFGVNPKGTKVDVYIYFKHLI